MSIDDDFFDLQRYIEEDGSPRNRSAMLPVLDRVQEFHNSLIQERDELGRQNAALKAAIVVKASDIKITDVLGQGRYIHLELKKENV